MVILLVPLDERPVSSELPGLIAAIAGAQIRVPPPATLPSMRSAGDVDAIAGWLGENAAGAAGAVISLEGLGLGGLVPSRIGSEPLERVIDRWSVLRGLGDSTYASVLVPRAPDSDDAFEDPEYWAAWGRTLHRLSTELGSDSSADPDASSVPQEVRADWLSRRLRQHVLGLAALGLVSDGAIARLVVGVDDAVPCSLSALAQRDLANWSARLGVNDRVVVGPGADETGAVLTARLIADSACAAPRVVICCAEEGGLDRVAPYETGPVITTARNQLRAAGAVPVDDLVDEGPEGDAVLVVHAPQSAGDWAVAPPTTIDASAAHRTAELVRRELDAGRAVAVADVAQPNGADPALVRALLANETFHRLDGFAAWNTAGNTLGTVAATLIVTLVARSNGSYRSEAAARHRRLRLIEDAAYMSSARARFRSERGLRPDRHDQIRDPKAASARVAELLNEALVELGVPEFATVQPEHVTFPWSRSFEIRLDAAAGER
ncbi:DUF4127 family protein [Microcella daejeonensis]|uniref:DUF4127 family protein n=1 Tax=Microcella daejeonensis TaxID=2994971 RepID=UPI00226D9256|nr:DUF4127 family protein [Microcella daejeonensis]WAB84366.1 DUF4127 family protein [Microcella daejeonensis]